MSLKGEYTKSGSNESGACPVATKFARPFMQKPVVFCTFADVLQIFEEYSSKYRMNHKRTKTRIGYSSESKA